MIEKSNVRKYVGFPLKKTPERESEREGMKKKHACDIKSVVGSENIYLYLDDLVLGTGDAFHR